MVRVDDDECYSNFFSPFFSCHTVLCVRLIPYCLLSLHSLRVNQIKYNNYCICCLLDAQPVEAARPTQNESTTGENNQLCSRSVRHMKQ